MTIMTYEKKIAALLSNYLRPKTASVATLAAALGCNSYQWRNHAWCVTSKKPADEPNESIVANALVSALHWHVRNKKRAPEDGLLLLDGLLKNERWRLCLLTIESSHDLAMLLVRQVSKLRDAKMADQAHPLMATVRTVINEWLNIDPAAYTYIPTAEPLARAMFGTAWCDLLELMLPAGQGKRNPQTIEEMIGSTQPAFLPGICPAQDRLQNIALPALD